MNWHYEAIAAKLTALYQRRIGRLIINVPPRHLKSHLASVAFPAWCLGHEPSTQILCVSYAQDLADKLARDCRRIMMSEWVPAALPDPAVAEAPLRKPRGCPPSSTLFPRMRALVTPTPRSRRRSRLPPAARLSYRSTPQECDRAARFLADLRPTMGRRRPRSSTPG